MTCQVCGNTGDRSSTIVKDRLICNRCGFPCVPATKNTLERFKAMWKKTLDDYINGHKHGTYADQADEMVYFDKNTMKIQREGEFA